jgi:hypothetical protein
MGPLQWSRERGVGHSGGKVVVVSGSCNATETHGTRTRHVMSVITLVCYCVAPSSLPQLNHLNVACCQKTDAESKID